MDFFNSVGKKISDAGQSTIQKTKDMAEIARLNSAISDENKRITGIYEQLGKRYIENFGDAPDESLQEFVTLVREAEQRINDYNENLKTLRGITKCPNCGGDVPNGSQFCASCGTRVVPEQAAVSMVQGRVCPVCGANVPEENRFCTSCGNQVQA